MYFGPNDNPGYAVPLSQFSFDRELATRLLNTTVFCLVATALRDQLKEVGNVMALDMRAAIETVREFVDEKVRRREGRWLVLVGPAVSRQLAGAGYPPCHRWMPRRRRRLARRATTAATTCTATGRTSSTT